MKILINILLLFCGIYHSFAQTDSIFGTYQTISLGGFSPTITLFSNNTFSYQSSIDVGYVPTTFGYLEFSDDTVAFKYREQIHPEIRNTETQFNSERKNILLKISANMSEFQDIALYVNKPFTQNSRTYSFKSNTIEIDSILHSDSLFIHFGNYSYIPIILDLENFNEYHYFINLPKIPTIYYLTESKALIKNGLLYFSMTTDGVPYYNKNVFVKKKDIRKILDFISTKRKEEWKKISEKK
jgi:hypothetical protein